ncbi:MAG: ZIP family metal transporter [Nanoarchaeota archaeon]
MLSTWLYTIVSVLLVSIVSFLGIISLSIKAEKLKKILIYLISFSAGALFADAFLHLLPEISEDGLKLNSALLILVGIVIFFSIEKFIHWQHCHMPITKDHVHPFAIMNLIGDGLHNFLDGLIIGAGYLLSIPAGIATTIAVLIHEIPQEIGDFSILIHGGFSKAKALLLNFLSAIVAILGGILALVLNSRIENIALIIAPLAIGGFIYIAGSDLIPELHKESTAKKSIIQLICFIIGIILIGSLLFLE